MYRTVFTPTSDDQWQDAIEKIRAYIEFEIMPEMQLLVKTSDDRPNKEVIKIFELIPICDHKFDGASL